MPHFVPVEAKVDAVEGFANHEVAGRRAGVEEFKNFATEGDGGNEEEEAVPRAAERLGMSQPVVAHLDQPVAKGVAAAGGELVEEFLGEGVVGRGGQRGKDQLENGVKSAAGCPS